MTDSGDRPLPPSYEEVMKNASAPPVLDVDQPTHPSQPSYLSYPGGGQPPYLSGTQPPYPSPNQVPYHGVGQQPYPSAGQGPYPYQNAPGGPNYAYPPQAPYGSQPGPMPFNQQPGHPAQYTHSMVTAAPANVAVGSAGYQTTPMAYGNSVQDMNRQRNRKLAVFIFVFIFIMFFIVTIVIAVSARS